MGLFRNKIKSPISGTAQITGCSAHGGEGRWQNCRMHLVVHVDGWEPYSAEVHQIAPRAKWPQPGMVVPVIVSKNDPQKLKVDFDGMPSGADRARQMADQHAAALRGDPGAMPGMPGVAGMPVGSPGPGGLPGNVTIVGDLNDLSPEKLAKLEQMTGLDLDGDGQVGGSGGGAATAGGAAAAPAGGDRVGQLERLAQLRGSGVLTDAEFEQEKRRILGS